MKKGAGVLIGMFLIIILIFSFVNAQIPTPAPDANKCKSVYTPECNGEIVEVTRECGDNCRIGDMGAGDACNTNIGIYCAVCLKCVNNVCKYIPQDETDSECCRGNIFEGNKEDTNTGFACTGDEFNSGIGAAELFPKFPECREAACYDCSNCFYESSNGYQDETKRCFESYPSTAYCKEGNIWVRQKELVCKNPNKDDLNNPRKISIESSCIKEDAQDIIYEICEDGCDVLTNECIKCKSDSECNDDNECTIDGCVFGKCMNFEKSCYNDDCSKGHCNFENPDADEEGCIFVSTGCDTCFCPEYSCEEDVEKICGKKENVRCFENTNPNDNKWVCKTENFEITKINPNVGSAECCLYAKELEFQKCKQAYEDTDRLKYADSLGKLKTYVEIDLTKIPEGNTDFRHLGNYFEMKLSGNRDRLLNSIIPSEVSDLILMSQFNVITDSFIYPIIEEGLKHSEMDYNTDKCEDFKSVINALSQGDMIPFSEMFSATRGTTINKLFSAESGTIVDFLNHRFSTPEGKECWVNRKFFDFIGRAFTYNTNGFLSQTEAFAKAMNEVYGYNYEPTETNVQYLNRIQEKWKNYMINQLGLCNNGRLDCPIEERIKNGCNPCNCKKKNSVVANNDGDKKGTLLAGIQEYETSLAESSFMNLFINTFDIKIDNWKDFKEVLNIPNFEIKSGEEINLGELWSNENVVVDENFIPGKYRIYVNYETGSGIYSGEYEFEVE